jgi:hypothetical protein
METSEQAEFVAACGALLSGSSSAEARRAADAWMTGFQRSAQAWRAADAVLAQPAGAVRGAAVAFLAAKCLQTKVRYDLGEQVGVEQLVGLRARLTAHLRQWQHERAVATQLCLSLVSLLLQSPSSLDLRLLAQEVAAEASLLEVLTLLPEEHAEGTYFSGDRAQRARINGELFDSANDVLLFLASREHLGEGALRCLRAWVSLVEPQGEVLASSGLLERLAAAVAGGEENAASAVAALVAVLGQYRYHWDDPGHAAVLSKTLPLVVQLEPTFSRASREDDDELAGLLARVFCAAADAVPTADDLLRLVLLASQHANWEVAAHTWHFWCGALKRMVGAPELEDEEEYNGHEQERQLRRREEQQQQQLQHQQGQQEQLARKAAALGRELFRCCLRCAAPQQLGVLTTELEDDFYFSRRDMSTLLLEPLFRDRAFRAAAREALLAAAAAGDWCAAESALFCAAMLPLPGHESADVEQASALLAAVLDKAAPAALTAPPRPLLAETLARLLRSAPREVFEPALACALRVVVAVPSAGRVAAESVVALARRHASVASAAHAEGLLRLALDRAISQDERLDVVEALALVIDAQGGDQAVAAVRHVAMAMAALLDSGSVADVCFALHALTTLFRMVRDQATLPTFSQLFPGLCELTRRSSAQARVAERLASLFKVAIRSYGDAFEPFLAVFLALMTEGFRASHGSPFVYATGIALEAFSGPQHRQLVAGALAAVATTAVEVLRNQQAFVDQPDVVEDVFVTMKRGLKHAAADLVRVPAYPDLCRSAVSNLLMDHRQACGAVLLFLEVALKQGQLEASLHVPLLRQLVAGICGASPRNLVSSVDDGSLAMTLRACARALGPDAFHGELAGALKATQQLDNQTRERALAEIADAVRIGADLAMDDACHHLSDSARKRRDRKV